MFKNVLVGVDGRPASCDAIALARKLLDADGRLTLAYVETGVVRPSHLAVPVVQADVAAHARELLESTRTAARVKAETAFVTAGSAGRGLHQRAEEQGADLIVVGSCNRGLLGRAMLGNDTRAALNGAPCAVAAAARGLADEDARLERIGVGYDGTAESVAAVAAARRLAASSKARLRALRVVWIAALAQDGLLRPPAEDAVVEALDAAHEELAEMPDVEGRATYGLPGRELASFGDELDLLVIGSRGYGPVSRLMLGSTSDYLVRHARCSLLVLSREALAHRREQQAQRVAPLAASQAA